MTGQNGTAVPAWSAVVPIAGMDYTARIPHDLHPDSTAAAGHPVPQILAPALLSHLAAVLAVDGGHGFGTWRAVAMLCGEDDQHALGERLGRLGDPLTMDALRAGMLAAVTALSVVVPRPVASGATRPVPVDIAGKRYTAHVPEAAAGLPAAALAGGWALPPALGPAIARRAGASVLGLLLFDEATLYDFDQRMGDPADSCTPEDIAAGVGQALAALAGVPAGGLPVDDPWLERQIDASLDEIEHRERRGLEPVVMTVAGKAYPLAHPRGWVAFLEAVAAMGPLTRPAEGVDDRVRLEGLASLVALAAPMVLRGVDVETLVARVTDPGDACDLVDVAEGLLGGLVDLDQAYTRARTRGLEAARRAAPRTSVAEGVGGP